MCEKPGERQQKKMQKKKTRYKYEYKMVAFLGATIVVAIISARVSPAEFPRSAMTDHCDKIICESVPSGKPHRKCSSFSIPRHLSLLGSNVKHKNVSQCTSMFIHRCKIIVTTTYCQDQVLEIMFRQIPPYASRALSCCIVMPYSTMI